MLLKKYASVVTYLKTIFNFKKSNITISRLLSLIGAEMVIRVKTTFKKILNFYASLIMSLKSVDGL